LRSSDIVLLPYGLFPQQLVKLASRLLCFLVIALDLAFLPIFLEQSQKVKHLAVGGNVDDAIG